MTDDTRHTTRIERETDAPLVPDVSSHQNATTDVLREEMTAIRRRLDRLERTIGDQPTPGGRQTAGERPTGEGQGVTEGERTR